MRRLFFAMTLLALALPQAASAQYEEYLELLRSDLKTARVAIFTEVLALSDRNPPPSGRCIANTKTSLRPWATSGSR